jgi:hypothetical protein
MLIQPMLGRASVYPFNRERSEEKQ